MILFPHRFIDEDYPWHKFDLVHWSNNEYEYEKDDWNGLKDVVAEPYKTVQSGKGDCDDYAAVAMSYLTSLDSDEDVTLVLCGSGLTSEHTFVSFGDNIYSSGEIYNDTSIDEYIEQSDFDWSISRTV